MLLPVYEEEGATSLFRLKVAMGPYDLWLVSTLLLPTRS